MNHALPMFACGSMGITDAQVVLILSVIAGWIIGLVLTGFNLVLLSILKTSKQFRIINLAILSVYVGLGILLFYAAFHYPGNASKAYDVTCQFLTFAIPAGAMSHFAFLVWTWRKIHVRRQSEQK